MNLQGIDSLLAASRPVARPTIEPPNLPAAKDAGSTSHSFLDMLGEQLENVNQQQHDANQQVQQLALGNSEGIHDVVLSVAKADLMFRMVLEIRNRLVESYQEVMRMQV